MAIVKRSHAISSDAASATLTVTAPAGLTDGDLITIFAADDAVATAATMAISGFVRTAENGSGCALALFTKTASSEGASWSLTGGNAVTPIIAVAIAWNPYSGNITIDDSNDNVTAGDTALTSTSITAVSGGFFAASFANDGGVALAAPAPTGTVVGAYTVVETLGLGVWIQEGVGAGGITDTATFASSEEIVSAAITASSDGSAPDGGILIPTIQNQSARSPLLRM